MIFDHFKILIPVLDQYFEISNLNFLNERVVKCETNFYRLLYITNPGIPAYHKRRKILTVYTVNQFFLFTVGTVEKPKYLLHGSFIVSLCVKLSIFVEILSNLGPCDACSICLCYLFLATKLDVGLHDIWNDQILVVWNFKCLG